jgi:flagellar protein FliS
MNGVSTYQSRQLNGASPALLVAMMIEKAIASLKEAIRAIEAKDVQARWQANNRASEIINHLWLTLDTEAGGEIADNLGKLYEFMMNHLLKVDLRNDPKPAEEVIELLEPLLQSWRTLAARGEGASPRSAAPAAAIPTPVAGGMRLSA